MVDFQMWMGDEGQGVSQMKKPFPVKILEWWFGVLAGLALLLPLPVAYGALREGKGNWELLIPAIGLCVGILFFWGLFLAVRRGQWASAEFPYWSLILFFLAPLPYKWRSLPESMGMIFLGVMLALAGMPSVCFHLRSSRLWFKERRGNRGPGYLGGGLSAVLILLLAAGAFLPAFHSGRTTVWVNRGREVSLCSSPLMLTSRCFPRCGTGTREETNAWS